jgi:tryptophanyl-tRNA synthetase
VREPEKMSEYILEIALDYLTIGLDPKKTILFQQSRVSEHTELAQVLNCLTPFSELTRAHAYKDAVAKNEKINVGLFTYPVLMAADILLYDTDKVPVGRDQAQHLEMASDLAKRFNAAYGETFKIPKPYILKHVETIPGLDGRKMSKSYGNTIELFEPAESLRKKIMGIKTGSERLGQPLNPETDIVFALHKLLSPEELPEIRQRYETGTIGYKESKEILLKNAETLIGPLRIRREKIAKNMNTVYRALDRGAKKAQKIAARKMEIVRTKIGVQIH